MYRRKVICVVAALLLVLVATGCGKKSKGGVPTPGAASGSGQTSGGSTPSGGSTSSGSSGSGSSSTSTPSGSGQGGSSTSGTAPAAPAKPAVQLVKVGPLEADKEAVMGPLTFKIENMEARSAGMTFPGHDFFLLQVTIKNTGREGININSLNVFTLMEPAGQVQRLNVQAQSIRKDRLDGILDPGKSITGWVGYLTKIVDGQFKLVITVPDLGEATYVFEAPPM